MCRGAELCLCSLGKTPDYGLQGLWSSDLVLRTGDFQGLAFDGIEIVVQNRPDCGGHADIGVEVLVQTLQIVIEDPEMGSDFWLGITAGHREFQSKIGWRILASSG
jgi:hypothetical protein